MTRYTSAYSAFNSRVGEVETLRRHARSQEKIDPVKLRNDVNALCRGAIVLLSGHVEAFIRDLGELAIDSMHAKQVPRTNLPSSLFFHISQDIISEVKATNEPARIADKIFAFLQDDLPYWSRTGPFPDPVPTDRFNRGFSNPAFEKIRSYFNRFGYMDYRSDLASRLRARYQPTVNMVDHLVDTRNKIAHGDPNASKTPSEIADMISIMRLFCNATDAVFATWWRANFCAIR